MTETAEGIAACKWCFQKNDKGFRPNELILSHGVLPLAYLSDLGNEVKFLLVTSPQLWSAANEMVLHALKLAGGDYSKLDNHVLELAKMVAKSVGQPSFSGVKQA